jgi:hypothetical protein
MPTWFFVSLLALACVLVLVALLAYRAYWFALRNKEMLDIMPLLERLTELANHAGASALAAERFAVHFDNLAHVYFSAAFSDKSARRLIVARLRGAAYQLSEKGIVINTIIKTDRHFEGSAFLRTKAGSPGRTL